MEEELVNWLVKIAAVVAALAFLFRFRIITHTIAAMEENLALLFVGKVMYLLGVSK